MGGGASFREVVDPTEVEGEAGAAAAALDDEAVVFFVSLEAADVSEPLNAARWLSKYDDMVAASADGPASMAAPADGPASEAPAPGVSAAESF